MDNLGRATPRYGMHKCTPEISLNVMVLHHEFFFWQSKVLVLPTNTDGQQIRFYMHINASIRNNYYVLKTHTAPAATAWSCDLTENIARLMRSTLLTALLLWSAATPMRKWSVASRNPIHIVKLHSDRMVAWRCAIRGWTHAASAVQQHSKQRAHVVGRHNNRHMTKSADLLWCARRQMQQLCHRATTKAKAHENCANIQKLHERCEIATVCSSVAMTGAENMFPAKFRISATGQLSRPHVWTSSSQTPRNSDTSCTSKWNWRCAADPASWACQSGRTLSNHQHAITISLGLTIATNATMWANDVAGWKGWGNHRPPLAR